jgi:hypothetical protein
MHGKYFVEMSSYDLRSPSAPPDPLSPPLLRNVVLTGDCLAVLPGVPDGAVDLTVFFAALRRIRDYENNWSLTSAD